MPHLSTCLPSAKWLHPGWSCAGNVPATGVWREALVSSSVTLWIPHRTLRGRPLNCSWWNASGTRTPMMMRILLFRQRKLQRRRRVAQRGRHWRALFNRIERWLMWTLNWYEQILHIVCKISMAAWCLPGLNLKQRQRLRRQSFLQPRNQRCQSPKSNERPGSFALATGRSVDRSWEPLACRPAICCRSSPKKAPAFTPPALLQASNS